MPRNYNETIVYIAWKLTKITCNKDNKQRANKASRLLSNLECVYRPETLFGATQFYCGNEVKSPKWFY